MIDAVGPAGADDGQVDRPLGRVRQPVGDPECRIRRAASIARGRPAAAPGFAHRGDDLAETVGQRLAGQLVQQRLGIEQVQMARAAFHEQEDAALGPSRDAAASWRPRARPPTPPAPGEPRRRPGARRAPAASRLLTNTPVPNRRIRRRRGPANRVDRVVSPVTRKQRDHSTYKNSLAFSSTWQKSIQTACTRFDGPAAACREPAIRRAHGRSNRQARPGAARIPSSRPCARSCPRW